MTYAVFGVLTEMVLRLGRYTFDGNALPRPQLGDESAGQLIGYAKFLAGSRVNVMSTGEKSRPADFPKLRPQAFRELWESRQRVLYTHDNLQPRYRATCLESTINLVVSRDLRPRCNVRTL